jgi:formylmethanofuran dehydrogenase subunit B
MEESKVSCTRCDFVCDDILVALDHLKDVHDNVALVAPAGDEDDQR